MNLQTAALKIHAATVDFLAAKHCVSVAEVEHHLGDNDHLTRQYRQLVTLAIDKAADMVRNGEIEVTA